MLLCADKLLSGLESSAALGATRALRAAASTGRTVLCTLHAAPADAFACFDQLLLVRRGKTLYCGPVGHRSEDVLGYFGRFQGSQACTKGGSPAMYLLQVCAWIKNMPSPVCHD